MWNTRSKGPMIRAVNLSRDTELLEILEPKSGKQGRPPQILKLTEQGREAFLILFNKEAVPSELNELMKRHKSLEHALLNLVINARQAMHSQGTITVDVAATANGSAVVRVQDTGPGIRPEHLGEIFKPFFTTKPRGQGTGLGLAAVQRFVLSSNGEIAVESGSAPGACFRLCFPLATTSGEAGIPPLTLQQATG